MDLKKVLEITVSPDTTELEQAQKFLEDAAQTNWPQFMVELAKVLADTNNSNVARVAAGLQLKNHLTSKDPDVRLQHQQRWLTLDPEVRNMVKTCVLRTLGTEAHKLSSAAQCVASIACAELPRSEWLEVIDILVQNVTDGNSSDALKEASLESIGYICQDIDPTHIANYYNPILTAIVQGARKEEPNNNIRFAATTALLNSLEFTKANFENEQERHFIMQVTCEATQCADSKVKVAALQCLVKIVTLYYQHMEAYMGPALFAITTEAMKSSVDEIALQGIEFWSNICDEEMDLNIEYQEADEMGKTPENASKFYAKGALFYLVPILLETLTKQEENEDDDEWNPCKAAGVCLMLLANCCENAVVPYVLPFIYNYITHSDWHYRDAAVMAFGSILEGPDSKELEKLVIEAVPFLINLFKDINVVVRDTVAWTVGRICELHPQVLIDHEKFPDLLDALLGSLDVEPRVAANVCWAFSSLAENAYDAAIQDDTEEPHTYCLSQKFEDIIAKLLNTTLRQDAHLANLRSAAYEALMEMIKNSPTDCYATVQKTTLEILNRIDVLQYELKRDSSDKMQYQDLQSLLCATLQSVLRKMKKEDAQSIANNVMKALLQMLSSTKNVGSGVQEDAFVAVGTLVESIGADFMVYMEVFLPYLYTGLQNRAEYQVCMASVGLVGDLCRALNTQITPMCDKIMHYLVENLGDQTVHRMVKPQILSVFGDIALAIGPAFKNYLPIVLTMLKEASAAQVDKTDYDMIDYLNELREGCLEGYTGIIQGLKGDSTTVNEDVKLILPHVEHIVQFIELIQNDEDHTDSNVAAASGVLGDLCCAFGSYGEPVARLFDKPAIQQLLNEGKRSKAQKTKSLATWAAKEIRKVSHTVQV